MISVGAVRVKVVIWGIFYVFFWKKVVFWPFLTYVFFTILKYIAREREYVRGEYSINVSRIMVEIIALLDGLKHAYASEMWEINSKKGSIFGQNGQKSAIFGIFGQNLI